MKNITKTLLITIIALTTPTAILKALIAPTVVTGLLELIGLPRRLLIGVNTIRRWSIEVISLY